MAGYRGGKGSSTLKGSFLNGSWHCDCNPPLIAVHLQVKKPGANKGRWFRVCQKGQEDTTRCKFFLWDTDAAPREAAALQNNSRTEPGRSTPAPAPAPEAHAQAQVQVQAQTQAAPSAPNQKRSRANFQEDDEYALGDVSAEDFTQAAIEAETPSKKARMETFTTPARRKLPWQNEPTTNAGGLQTPQTDQQRPANPFVTSASRGASLFTPSRNNLSDDQPVQTATPSSSPMDTPTPNRFRDIGAESDLARDVFGILRGASITLGEHVRGGLTAVLSKHATEAIQAKKGHEALRAVVKAKNARNTELTYRINTLEAELEAEKQKVGYLQLQVQNGQDLD